MVSTEAEWKILTKLWEQPRTIMQLTKALFEETGWKKNTVITLLNRMCAKGTAYYIKGEKARTYYPIIPMDEAGSIEAEKVTDRFFDGKYSMMISALVARDKISKEEIDEICKALGVKQVK